MAVRSSTARRWEVLFASCVAAVFALAGAGGASPATGDDPSDCPSSTRDAYQMTAGALTGPTNTDVGVTFIAAPGCAAVTFVKHLQLKWFDEDGTLAGVRNLDDLKANEAVATVRLHRIARGRRVEAAALIQTGLPIRTYVVRDTTTARLRPDLAVEVHAPAQTLTTRPVDVTADVHELKGDTGAGAQVVLADAVGALTEPVPVTVPAGGSASVTFRDVALTTATPVDLRVLVTDAAPGEYDTLNNTAEATVDVTNNELAPLSVLLPSLGGYGFQFNGHLYAPITNPPPASLDDLEAKVKALDPQFVRIFFNDNWELNADKTHPEWEQNLQSFRDVVKLADDTGATITIAYQTVATAKTKPADWMTRFADVLQSLVRDDHIQNLRWVSIGNEPNTASAFTLAQYEALYRALDAQLKDRGLRDQIGLIGGDLVENTENTAAGHRAWFDYMVTHMNDVIDAWSEHIYWNYWDHFRMEERLKDVAHLVHDELPASAQKPTFIMEFGVRGADTCGTKPALKAAYYLNPPDCTDLRRMSLAGFQKVWFTINAAQLGFDAASDWDLYWSVYDKTKANQSYWTIGPPEEGWALYPSYYAFQLLFQTTTRGWQVLQVDPWNSDDEATRYDDPHPDQPEQELTAYRGPDGQLTIAGLDTHGGLLTEPNGETSSYSIGGLPPSTTFTLVIWNGDGKGTNSIAGPVVTNAAGVARFDVPMQAAFVLTTVPVS